ncbi:MAG: fimbrillin family protein [Alistipes sp.]|nr:fimbrillin family protein [Alistipes sp.]
MKKFLLGLLALAAVACTNDDVVKQEGTLISFGDSFVEIKTRAAADPSITTATIDAFDVWGFISQPSGVVFDAERVTKSAEGWSYKNLQWWLPKNNYYFFAVAPVDNANIKINTKDMTVLGLGNIDFTNEDGSVDLLYTEKTVVTGDDVINNDPGKVELQFHHMLSKVKFTFTNGFTNENAHLAVKNVKIFDAPKNGNIDVNTDSWKWYVTPNQTFELMFGDVNGGNPFDIATSQECDKERLTIPADNTRAYTIEFDLELYQGDQLGHTSHKIVKLQNQAFEIGKNYNIKATITPENFDENALKPIEFDVVEVEKWVEGDFNGNIDWDDNTLPTTPVALATPVVTATVAENVVTLSWAAIEGAKEYSVQVDDDVAETVTATTYTFNGDYEVEYTFTVKAIAADATKNTDSEAAVVKATTEAKPAAPAVTYTTVAEFLAAEVNAEVEYTLKGTITAVANTKYGNFDLTDETGTVYIYGLCSPEGAQQYWATSGAKLGDDIVIKTVRNEFNGKAQGYNAKFVELITPGTIAFWSFDKTAVSFGAAGGEQQVNVTACNVNEAIQASSNNTHFTVAYADGVLTITAAENTSAESVNGVVTVTCGALKQDITLTQAGASVGGGTEVVAEKTMASFGWANSATVKEAKLDDNVTVTFAQGKAGTAPAFYTSGNAVRLYQNGATMKITAGGKTIKAIELKFASNHWYIAPDCGEFSAEGATRTWTGDATEILFTTTGTDSSHRAYIASIKVTYID